MRTVITYGTFDLFHKGHYNILKRAKEEGDYLIVAVTGETYDAERGKLSVQDSLATRIENVRATGFADKIIVEEYLGQKIPDIINNHVDVLVIGSDWKGKFDHLSKYCEVKYLERTKNISSTEVREKTLKMYRWGVVTEDLDDKECIFECELVSGIHAEGVFAQDQQLADEFRDKFDLNCSFSDYDQFLEAVDIVYVKTGFEKRRHYIEEALKAGKHVVYDTPCTLDPEEEAELRWLAKEKGVVLMEALSTLYLKSFGQLLWMARGNLIGDLVSVKCSITQQMLEEHGVKDFLDICYVPICVIFKILGADFEKIDAKIIQDEEHENTYGLIDFFYKNAFALAELNTDEDAVSELVIQGTRGEIRVPNDWWLVSYFIMKQKGEKRAQNYSSNFEGNGFRYVVQALMKEIRAEESGDTARVTEEESAAILRVLKDVAAKYQNTSEAE